MSDYRGRFVWHELMTTDTKSAGAFYSKIIGWKTQPWGKDLSGAEYTLFVSGKRQLAGLMAVPDDAKKWECRPIGSLTSERTMLTKPRALPPRSVLPCCALLRTFPT